jgi:hypothetical protein
MFGSPDPGRNIDWIANEIAAKHARAAGDVSRVVVALAQRLWLTTSTLCPSGSRTKAP